MNVWVALWLGGSHAWSSLEAGHHVSTPEQRKAWRSGPVRASALDAHSHSHSFNAFEAVRWTTAHLSMRGFGSRESRLQAKDSAARAADRITWIGAGVNVMLTIFKLYAGVVSRSAAMISDAVHSASDLLSDVVTLVAMRSARRPADSDHPYGHGRFETVGAMFVGTMLTCAAWSLAGNAVGSLNGAVEAEQVSKRLALVAAAVSIVAKEALYRATEAVGRRIRSPVLQANAWHHRSDAMSSVVALVGIAASAYPALWFADALAGLVVAFMLFSMGLRVSMKALGELTDGVDDRDLHALRDVCASVQGVKEVAACRGRLVAGALVAEVDLVATKADLTTSACDQLAERARLALLKHAKLLDGKELLNAQVRVVPAIKLCPVVVSMPAEEQLTATVEGFIADSYPHFVYHDSVVRYDRLEPSIDIILRCRNPDLTVGQLDEAAGGVRAAVDRALGTCARVNAIHWLSPPPPPPPQVQVCDGRSYF